jgi:hypothetical protein
MVIFSSLLGFVFGQILAQGNRLAKRSSEKGADLRFLEILDVLRVGFEDDVF